MGHSQEHVQQIVHAGDWGDLERIESRLTTCTTPPFQSVVYGFVYRLYHTTVHRVNEDMSDEIIA